MLEVVGVVSFIMALGAIFLTADAMKRTLAFNRAFKKSNLQGMNTVVASNIREIDEAHKKIDVLHKRLAALEKKYAESAESRATLLALEEQTRRRTTETQKVETELAAETDLAKRGAA